MKMLSSMKNFLIISAQPSIRRSNVPPLPRVANNGTDATTPASTAPPNRPPSAGDSLRRISYTRKLNRSNSEKTNPHTAPPSGSQQNSPVS
jgi:hypothetical protein